MARRNDVQGGQVVRHLPARRALPAGDGLGRCTCGRPAEASCTAGCGRDVCGEHLLHRSSRLASPGPYRSEREHTAYLRGFWANGEPLCAWCRELAGTAAVATLAPVPPLPSDVAARLAVLRRHPHDYPADAWPDAIRRQGGPAQVAAVLAARLMARHRVQTFEGRRRGQALTGVPLGVPRRDIGFEVVDSSGTVWLVRAQSPGLSKRRVWSWEPAAGHRVEAVLPALVDLATTGDRPR
jgi:hypothetical protein